MRALRALGIGLLLAVLLVLSLPGLALLGAWWAWSALRLALADDNPNHQNRSDT